MRKKILFILALSLVNSSFSQNRKQQLSAEMEEAFNKGYQLLYTKKDSSYYFFNKALEYAVSLKDLDSQLSILTFLTYANGYHYDLEDCNYNLKRREKILDLDSLKTTIKDYEPQLYRLLLDKGNYYYNTKDYEKAKSIFLQLKETYEKIPLTEINEEDAGILFSVYNYLGATYKYLGKYDLSEQYYFKNRSMVMQCNAFNSQKQSYIVSVDQLLAQLYSLINKDVEANQILYNAVKTYQEYYKKDKKFKNTLIATSQKLIKNYVKQDSLQLALDVLNKSHEYLLIEDPFFKESLLLYGDVYTKQDNYKKALDSYLEALLYYKTYRNYKPHHDIANVYAKITELHLKQQDFKSGLVAIQEALNVSGESIKINSYNEAINPELVFSKKQLLQLLDLKLQLLELAYDKTGDSSYLNAGVSNSENMLLTFNLLKKEFESKVDKQFLAEICYPIFCRMMHMIYRGYEKNKTPEILELALNVAEKNKDFLLLEALRDTNASKYGEVPLEILEKEKQLRSKITHLEKQLFDTNKNHSQFSNTLFELKETYYKFQDTLKNKYPRYHNLKYSDKTLDLSLIRKKVIKKNGALISYTVSTNCLFIIAINKNKAQFLKLPFTPVDKDDIQQFYKLLSKPSIDQEDKKLDTLSARIFNKILKPVLETFNEEHLTIIPDGVLNYIPFDILKIRDNESLSYVLEKKNIGYANAIGTLIELNKTITTKGNNILAFAPSFDNSSKESITNPLGKLLYNGSEIDKINAFYTIKAYRNKKATLNNFKLQAPKFNAIHLATHAFANDEFPDYSYLAFTQANDSVNNNMLYIKDLYNTTLHANMITLSACQTGIGKLQKGQGMMSLSKGFYYAGAKSLINTLWKINDKSTVRLMAYFYEELSKGQTKTEALQKAKLNYLATTEDSLLKHPYYWAAFTVSGNIEPITNAGFNFYWLLLIVPIILIIRYIKRH